MKYILILFLTTAALNAQSVSFTKVNDGILVNDIGSSQGFSFLDYDDDGYQDIIQVNYQAQVGAIYRNLGNNTFEKKGSSMGDFVTDQYWRSSIAIGDYDNDGDLDIFTPGWGETTVHNFYENVNGVFVGKLNANMIVDYPGYLGGDYPYFFDYNNDGWLDLFVLGFQNGEPNYLYRNNGNKTFTKVFNTLTNDYANSKNVAFSDYDNDGDIDLFVANMNSSNYFYENNGDGSFTKKTNLNILSTFTSTNYALFADLDNNGFDDLILVEDAQNGNVVIYYNTNGVFQLASNSFNSLTQYPSNVSVADYDNDGDLDVYINFWNRQNQLYQNNGDTSFSLTGILSLDSYKVQSAWQDLNNDGFQDVYISVPFGEKNVLYTNNANNSNNWIKLKVSPLNENLASEGSYISIFSTENSIKKIQRRLFNRINGNTGIIHFGMASAIAIDSLIINWIDGTITKRYNLSTNQQYSILQSTSNNENTLENGIIAKYNFDDNTANDQGVNSLNGIIRGNVTFENGVVGKCAVFNGSSSNYIEIPHNQLLNFGSSFSISFWVNASLSSQPSYILNKGRDIENSFHFSGGNTTIAFGIVNSYGNGGSTYQTSYTSNVWCNIVGVFDDDYNKMKFYYNGQKIDSVSLNNVVINNSYPVILGRHFTNIDGSGGFAYPFTGKIDEVRIYNRVLTPSEIATLYNSPAALPVELTSFTGNCNENKTELHWQTATEVNNYGFDVERYKVQGKSGEKWEKIGFVQGHGNSNSPKDYTFTDNTPPSGKVKYRLKQIDFDGKYEYSKEVDVFVEGPSAYVLEQNQPNPFNPETIIKYSIPVVDANFASTTPVTLKVYDILGREITTLVNEEKPAGNYSVNFNGSGLASGVYIYQIKAGKFMDSKKFVLMK